jgi:hypothetical protein
MLRFKDLVFKEDPDGLPLNSARIDYKLYTLSVVKETLKEGTYEVAIFKGDHFVQLPGINPDNDVIRYLSDNAVSNIMMKLASVTMHPGEPV